MKFRGGSAIGLYLGTFAVLHLVTPGHALVPPEDVSGLREKAFQRADLFARGGVPEPDFPVPAARRQRPPVRREADGSDVQLMAFQPGFFPAALRVPQADGAVLARGGERRAVRREGKAVDVPLMAVEGAKRGLDADGWADHARLAPPPASPELVLRDVVLVVEDATGPLGGHPRPPSVGASKQLTLAAAKLRWLRGATRDVERWAQAMGRLRWVAAQVGDSARELQSTLDPAFVPRMSWAEVVQAASAPR